ncbi:MAG: hypothetical protein CMB31_05000 [Euryarchaeota archaeon]|nr:hypothetical protein [Euryarchaeota archaeon]
MKYHKEYKRSSHEPSIDSNNATSGGSSHYSKELYEKKEPRKKPYSVLQRVKPRNRKRVEKYENEQCEWLEHECAAGNEESCMIAEEEGCDPPSQQTVTKAPAKNTTRATATVTSISGYDTGIALNTCKKLVTNCVGKLPADCEHCREFVRNRCDEKYKEELGDYFWQNYEFGPAQSCGSLNVPVLREQGDSATTPVNNQSLNIPNKKVVASIPTDSIGPANNQSLNIPNKKVVASIDPAMTNKERANEAIMNAVAFPATTPVNKFRACAIPSEPDFITEYASPGGDELFFTGIDRIPGILSGYMKGAPVGITNVFPKEEQFENSNIIAVSNFDRRQQGVTQEEFVKQNPIINYGTEIAGKVFEINIAQLYRPNLGEWDVLGFKLLTGKYKGKSELYGHIQWFKDNFDCGISNVYQFRLGNANITGEYLSKLPKNWGGGEACAPPPEVEGKDIDYWFNAAKSCTQKINQKSTDDKWWLKYDNIMWNDEKHYMCWKTTLDEYVFEDKFRGNLEDLPGPGRDTWNWNKGQASTPFTDGQESLEASNVNILYHSKQAYKELTFEILNGNLKNASKKEIRRKWLIKLMNHITLAFLDIISNSGKRLDLAIEEERAKNKDGRLTEQKFNELVNNFREIINNLIVVLVDNIRLVNLVYVCGNHTVLHDHDPDAYFTVLNQEMDSWVDLTIDHYKYALTVPGTASVAVVNKGGGNFTLVDTGNVSPEDTDDEGDVDPDDDDWGPAVFMTPPPSGTTVATLNILNSLNPNQLAVADIIRGVARNEGFTNIEYEAFAQRFHPLTKEVVELAELDSRPRGAVTGRDVRQVEEMKITVLNELRGGVGVATGTGEGVGVEVGTGRAQDVPAFPSKQNVEIFKRISKLLITAIIKDEPFPPEIIEIFNAGKASELTFEQGLKRFNEKNRDEFGENVPQLDASTSPMSKYIAVWVTIANHPNFESEMQGLKMLMAYLSLHMKGESEWIIETFRELLDSRYKNTKPITFAVQFIKKLNNVIKESEGVSDTDVKAAAGAAAARVAELEAQLAARPSSAEVESLKAQLEAARGTNQLLQDQLLASEAEATEAIVGMAEKSGETVDLKMEQIEDLGEEIINLKAELEAEKTKNNVPVDAEQIRKEEKDECKKEIDIFKGKNTVLENKIEEEKKKVENKDKMIKYGGIGAGVVIVLLILFLLMK